MYVGIVGSRTRDTAEDRSIVCAVIFQLFKLTGDLILVSGGCPRGADSFIEGIAKSLDLPEPIIHRPRVRRRASKREFALAAYARNTLIARDSDILFALPAPWPGGRGTRDTMQKAWLMKKKIVLL